MFKLLLLICALCITLVVGIPHFQMLDPENSYLSFIVPHSYTHILHRRSLVSAEENSITAVADSGEKSSVEEQDTGNASSSQSTAEPSIAISNAATGSSESSPPPPGSVRNSISGIEHRLLPPHIIPLPITVTTRAGLHTIIAPETLTIREPTLAKVGELVQQIPTAVSHQSQTVVHNHERVVTPILVPTVRTVTSHLVRAYHTPIVFAPQVTS